MTEITRKEELEFFARMADAVCAVWGVSAAHAIYLLGDMTFKEMRDLLTLDSFTHWDV